ncbi:hypothetical protein [Winogradskyella sp.]|nr:hypothetical protein [Winogradskyella sp.]MBO6879458.1 hypothetical protein [Winogradskyella sp.]
MDQKSSFHLEAKQILNDNNPEPYTDLEVIEVLELLEVFTDIICHNVA